MKSSPECIACLYRQAYNTAKLASPEPVFHEKILRRLGPYAATVSLDRSPAHISQYLYEMIADLSGNPDPFREIKKNTNERALALLPELEKLVSSSPDPLKNSIHLAVSGNVIDFGINFDLDLEKDVLALMGQEFTIDDTEAFRKDLIKGKNLLYLGDNSGEIVFDRVLVEELIRHGINVTFAVKAGPIINDVTLEDAQFTGITGITDVITTGGSDIGINWNRCSPEFSRAFRQADIILSKGHGNFETLSEEKANIYFLLKTKCDWVASEIGVPLGSLVFMKAGTREK